jgi:glycosyltransferase involved in cell wall biosynthesis
VKILILNYEYPPLGGGAGRQTRLLAREFAAAGHRVTVIASGMRGLPFLDTRDGFPVIRVPALRTKADRCGVLSMAAYPVSGLLASLTFGGRPDVILAFFLQPVGPAAWVLGKLTGAPYVISLRGGDVPSFVPGEAGTLHRLLSPVTYRVTKDATTLIAVSDDLAEMARRDFPFAEGKIGIISNGVEVLPYTISKRPEIPTLIFAGRLAPQKNLAPALRALIRIETDFRLHVLGDGPLRAELESIAAPMGERVVFHGWVDGERVNRFLDSAHYLLLPSLVEGLSNAGLQAFSRGVPILGADVPGVRGFVEDGRTGLLFAPDAESAMEAVLRRAIRQPGLSSEMAPACREAVRTRYSIREAARQYLEVLGKAIRGGSR